ncbi:MAG: hypothetical protein JWP06_305 [Candidatus Saccharibacteria bacterium]|nr:hypothetical protein [Candidatus Saccharibacteria bacterium]
MCVIGHREIFDALAPAVGPKGHIEPGAHFWRTLAPFITGYLNHPGNDTYARDLRRAHERAGISRKLLTMATDWNVTIMCQVAAARSRRTLMPSLVEAGKRMATDFGADPNGVGFHLPRLRSMFQNVTIIPEMREALWEVLDWPKIGAAVGPRSNSVLLADCQKILPSRFVQQFKFS